MEILLWVIAWLLAGCGVAWMIGSAASISDVTGSKHSPQHGADANIEHFCIGERATDEAANVPLATIGGECATSNRACRSDTN